MLEDLKKIREALEAIKATSACIDTRSGYAINKISQEALIPLNILIVKEEKNAGN